MTKQRQSNIELLRCFSMFCIIVYHIFIFSLHPVHGCNTRIYQALQIPFHIGVPLFVMISGYFGIRFSVRGLTTLVSKAYMYYIPLAIIPMLFAFPGIKDFVHGSLVFSYNNYWFLNCYLYLFLFSPVVNSYLQRSTMRSRIYLLLVLLFVSSYIGNVTEGDPALVGGKNLTNFIFLYVLGNTLHLLQHKINAISQVKLVVVYLSLNIFLVAAFMCIPFLSGKIWKFSFPYDSIIMYVNCILCFMIFSKLQITSKYINWIGGSIFACYLIQCPHLIWNNCFIVPTQYVDSILNTPWLTVPFVLIFSVFSIFVMVCVDKSLNPVWRFISCKSKKWDEKLETKSLN